MPSKGSRTYKTKTNRSWSDGADRSYRQLTQRLRRYMRDNKLQDHEVANRLAELSGRPCSTHQIRKWLVKGERPSRYREYIEILLGEKPEARQPLLPLQRPKPKREKQRIVLKPEPGPVQWKEVPEVAVESYVRLDKMTLNQLGDLSRQCVEEIVRRTTPV